MRERLVRFDERTAEDEKALCELNKKYKLELQNPTVQEIEAWIANVGE